MKRTVLISKTKFIARQVMGTAFFRILLLLLLESGTAIALSLVFSKVATRIAPEAVIRFWVFEIHWPAVLLTLAAQVFQLPLTLGLTEYLIKLVRRQEPKVADVFLWYSDGEKLKRVFSYFLYTAAFTVIEFPLRTASGNYLLDSVNSLLASARAQLQSGAATVTLDGSQINAVACWVSVAALLVFFYLNTRLLLTRFFVADSSTPNAFQAALCSWRVTGGHVLTYALLMLSFAGWYLACAFTMFLAAMYMVPYVQMSVVIFTEYIRADYAMRHISEAPAEDADESDDDNADGGEEGRC